MKITLLCLFMQDEYLPRANTVVCIACLTVVQHCEILPFCLRCLKRKAFAVRTVAYIFPIHIPQTSVCIFEFSYKLNFKCKNYQVKYDPWWSLIQSLNLD